MRGRLAVALILTLSLVGGAQEPSKPGAEHEILKRQEGEYTTTMKFGGMESKGSASFKMDLGGMWLVSRIDSEIAGTKFQGQGMDTYNSAKKKYLSIWVDSMTSAPVMMEGTFDKEKKVMMMEGAGPGMDGLQTKYRSESRMPDKDTIEMTMWIGDSKESAFTITYKRKK